MTYNLNVEKLGAVPMSLAQRYLNLRGPRLWEAIYSLRCSVKLRNFGRFLQPILRKPHHRLDPK